MLPHEGDIMELNITHLMERKRDMIYYSASVAELGDDAGSVTWSNAMDCVEEEPLIKEEDEGEFRDYVRTFGAWEDEEIDGWSSQECNALCLQLVAGDIREYLRMENPEESSIFETDDGEWFIYIGM